jgi:hypothetical protein
MSNNSLGEIIQPFHCIASGTRDKANVALTFQCEDRTPVTIILPTAGAVILQRNLAQALYLLSAKAPAAAVEPVPAQMAAE